MNDAKSITEALEGRWYGRYGQAYCPAHENTRTPALSLSDGHNGQLLAHCHAGCTFDEVIQALPKKGQLKAADGDASTKPTAMESVSEKSGGDVNNGSEYAKKIWRTAISVKCTLAECYLRGRGINCEMPDTLRFHPCCHHLSGQFFPTLVARVDGSESFAVHRTYLGPDGSKAALKPAKAMLGPVKGGAVRLRNAEGPLVVTEGIENALSIASGLLFNVGSIWASLSTSGMKALILPVEPHEMVICQDGEAAGRSAARSLAQRATADGWRVSIADPGDGLDFNDVLCGRTPQ